MIKQKLDFSVYFQTHLLTQDENKFVPFFV